MKTTRLLALAATLFLFPLSLPAQETPFGTRTGAQPQPPPELPPVVASPEPPPPPEEPPAEEPAPAPPPAAPKSPLWKELEDLQRDQAVATAAYLKQQDAADSAKLDPIKQRAVGIEAYEIAAQIAAAQKAILAGEQPAPAAIPAGTKGIAASIMSDYNRALSARASNAAQAAARAASASRPKFAALQAKAAKAEDYVLASQIKAMLAGGNTLAPPKPVAPPVPTGPDAFIGTWGNSGETFEFSRENGTIWFHWRKGGPPWGRDNPASINDKLVTAGNWTLALKDPDTLEERTSQNGKLWNRVVKTPPKPVGAALAARFAGTWCIHGKLEKKVTLTHRNGRLYFKADEQWWKERIPGEIELSLVSEKTYEVLLPHDSEARILRLDGAKIIETDENRKSGWGRGGTWEKEADVKKRNPPRRR